MAIPDELFSLIKEESSMFISNLTGALCTRNLVDLAPWLANHPYQVITSCRRCLAAPHLRFYATHVRRRLALLPPSLLDRNLKDVGLLVSQGPEYLTTFIVGVLAFDEVSNPSDSLVEHQVPFTGPMGNFVALLIGEIL